MSYGTVIRVIVIALASIAVGAYAAPTIDVISIDLPALIDQASSRANQFAVDVPHSISTGSNSAWSEASGVATWTYSMQVPSAVSLSFHASVVQLPDSARLRVTAADTTYEYRSEDIHKGELWSRIAKGERLDFELSVAASDIAQTRLEITSIQVGYRGFGPGASNHPHYDRLRKKALTASTATCVENFQCHTNPNNQGPAQATVALVVANIYQCSGTLLNNTNHDETPFVLTARHCQSGKLGGGAPQAALTTTVYWNAITPCGQILGSIYDSTILVQTGATTVAEQQDAWLIQLDVSPVAGAYFAGWDATGATVTGGYTVHHALSLNKQFTAWYGQAVAIAVPGSELHVSYQSNFLDVVNQVGSTAPGASGSGFFDANDRLVGVLSLGQTQSDSGDGVCPANPLTAANGSNGAADFTSFSAVFNSQADSTSSTGATTIRSALDPSNSGAVIVDGELGLMPISFSTDTPTPFVGDTVRLKWAAVIGSSCVASGAAGWSGTLPDTGSQNVSSSNAEEITYVITCTYGGRRSTARLTIDWSLPSPFAYIDAVPFTATFGRWTSQPVKLVWNSNQSPCSIKGKNVSLTNLASSGSTTVTETVAGGYSYGLSCGSGTRVGTNSVYLNFFEPSVTLHANSTQRIVGGSVTLSTNSFADYCVTSGGSAGDGWANKTVPASTSDSAYETVAGTYTYGVTCYAGAVSRSASATVTFTTGPPKVSLHANGTNLPFGNSLTLSWVSNVDNCTATESGSGNSGEWNLGVQPEDTKQIQELGPGTYTYSITCGLPFSGAAASDQVTVTYTPSTTSANVTASVSQATVGQSFTVSWNSTNAYSCTPSGGTGNDGWGGNFQTSGSFVVTESSPGTYLYSVTCYASNTQKASAQAIVAVSSTPPSGGNSGGSSSAGNPASGGGGAVDWLSLMILSALSWLARAPILFRAISPISPESSRSPSRRRCIALPARNASCCAEVLSRR